MPRGKKGSEIDPVELKLDLLKEHLDSHMKNVGGRLDKVDTRLDKMDDRLDKIDGVCVKNTAVLEEHVRRTELLETRVEQVKKETDEKLEKVEKEKIAPLEKHALKAKILIGILGLGGLGGAGIGIKQIIAAIFGGDSGH